MILKPIIRTWKYCIWSQMRVCIKSWVIPGM